MLRDIARPIVGPLFKRIVIGAARARGELPQPSGEPRVHAMGPDPDRILVIGAGAVRGIGVASHELGLGGQLARQLSARTGRGADVELLGIPGVTAAAALDVLAGIDLTRFDALVVMLGGREAIGLRSVAAWEHDIRMLLERVTRGAPTLSVFAVGIAPLSKTLPLSRLIGPMVNRQVVRLNAATRAATVAVGARFIPFTPGDGSRLGEIGSSSTYVAWADPVAAGMHATLDLAVTVPREKVTDEDLRQAALDSMRVLDMSPTAELDAIARVAKDLFGVSGAAVNLIDRDRQHMMAAWGIERNDLPRSESFCAVTLELGVALIIEDTRLDPRVSSLPAVGDGILFYAGYPVEAPNGQRIGTLCLFDTEPRRFTSADESLLRELALRVQAEFWKHSAVAAR